MSTYAASKSLKILLS